MPSHRSRGKSLAFLFVASLVMGCGTQQAPVSTSQRVVTPPAPQPKPDPRLLSVNWLSGAWDDDECAEFAAEGSLHLEYGGDLGFSRLVDRELLARLPKASERDAQRIIVVVAEHTRRFYSLGEMTAARGFATDLVLAADKRWGNGVEKALCQAVQGELLRADGSLNEAEKLLLAALKVQQESKNAHGLVSTYTSLGQLHYSMGEVAKARAALQQASELIQVSSDPRSIEVLTTLAEISIREGNLRDAESLLSQAREIKASDHTFLKSAFKQNNVGSPNWGAGSNGLSNSPMLGNQPEGRFEDGFPGGIGGEPAPHFGPQGVSPFGVRSPFGSAPPTGAPFGASAERTLHGQPDPWSSMAPDSASPWRIGGPNASSNPSHFSNSSAADQIRAKIRYRQRIERTWGRPRGSSVARMVMDFASGPDLDFQRNVIWVDIRLGQVYAALDETEKAIEHLLAAINKVRRTPGKVSLEHAFALNELGRVLIERGQLETAAKVLEEAVSSSPIDHSIRSLSLHNTGRLRIAQGRGEEAITLLEEAFEGELARIKELLPYLSEAQAMNYVAANVQQRDPFLYALRRSSQPENLLRAYSAVWRTRALATRAMMATRNWGKGNPKAQELAVQLIQIRQRLASLTHGSNKYPDSDRQIAELTADKERLEKQLGELRVAVKQESEAAAARKSTFDSWAISSTDPVVGELWTQLKSLRLELASLTQSSIPEPSAAERISSLTSMKENLEKQLDELRIAEERTAANRGHGKSIDSPRENPAPIAKDAPPRQYEEVLSLVRRLPLGVAIVDFIECDARGFVANPNEKPASENDNRYFYAFVLRRTNDRGDFHAAWTNLGPSRPISESITQWRQELRRPPPKNGKLGSDSDNANDQLQAAGLKVRQLVWEKIENELGDCRTVIVIPDRELTQIPWMALPGRQPNSYLLDEYAIGIAAYGQQLHDLLGEGAPPATPEGRMLLIGGVDYNHMPVENVVGPNLTSTRAAPRLHSGTSWGPLPGTENEL